MKLLGIECYGIMIPNKIQPQEIFQEVVVREAFYTFLRNSNGNRYVLYLYWQSGAWNWNVNWLDNDRNANNPSAVLATHFISPPPCYKEEEFCFTSCPCQPPSCFPASVSGSESAIYFFVSSALISQSM